MRKLLINITMAGVLISANTFADPLELAQLIEIVSNLNAQLEELKETADLTKQLAEMEQLETVQQLSAGGQALWQLGSELERTRELIGGFESPEKQLERLRDDVAQYFTLYDGASKEEDIIRSMKLYGNALADLENQYWTGNAEPNHEGIKHFTELFQEIQEAVALKKSQEDNFISITNGITAKEAPVIAATDQNTLLRIQLQMYYRQLQEDSKKAQLNAEQDLFFNSLMYQGVDLNE